MATYAYGLFGREYEGYYDGDPQWFSTATPTGSSDIRSEFNIPVGVAPNGFSYEWFGYFKPLSAEGNIADDFTFYVQSDDEMYMWIGDSALSGNFTAENRLLSAFGTESSAPINLRADTYYPVRIQWGHPVELTASALYIAANPTLRMANDFVYGCLFHEPDWLLYRGFYIRVNQLLDSGDPSINQIVFSNSSSAPVGRNRTKNTNNDDFYVSGLNGANTIAIVNLYGIENESGAPIPLTDIKNFAHTYIDNVLYDGETLRANVEDIQDAFYANEELLVTSMPEGTLYDYFDFNEIQAVYQEPTKGAVLYFNGNQAGINDYNENLVFVAPGSGYEVNEEFVIPGNFLGGVTPDNDLTVTVGELTPEGGITAVNLVGTPNTEANPVWFITDGEGSGDGDQYDQGNYLGTDRSRCTFTGSTNSNGDLLVTSVSQGQLSSVQSVYIEEDGDDGRFTSIVWQLSGTPGQKGLYFTGGYNTPDANLPSKTRYANAIPYGVDQTLDGTNAFGPGSSYGSMYLNSIFSMVAVNADINTFYYNGEFGADGSGEKVLTPLAPITTSELERVTELHGGVENFLRQHLLGYY